MPFLTRDTFLSAIQRQETILRDPDVDADIPARELLAIDKLDAIAAGEPDADDGRMRYLTRWSAVIVQRSVLDKPGGDLLFHPDDVAALSGARAGAGHYPPPTVVERLAMQIWEWSGAAPAATKSGSATADDARHADAGNGAGDAERHD